MKRASLLSLLCCGLAAAVTQPQFYARRDYPSAPGYIAVADVNGDGIRDVVTMSSTGIHTLLGNGNGTFRVGPTTNPGGVLGGFQLSTIDLNGDGVVDLIIAQGGGIEVCLGNGDGTFQPAVLYGPGGGGYLVVGDFNGDGVLDVAIPSNSGIYLYIGRGGGVFNSGVLTPINPYNATANVTLPAADFNRDGNLDLAVAYRSTGGVQINGFIVLFGNGDGIFQTPVFYGGSSPSWIAAGDLNGDGYPDIVVSGAYIYLNNGKGSFSAPTSASLPGRNSRLGISTGITYRTW